jgi:integron integrase
MKQMAKQLQDAVTRTLAARSVSPAEGANYLKWLRYYLDFCLKYRHAPRDQDSLSPFLQKLAEKCQDTSRQQQAAASVAIYYELMKTWAAAPEANAATEVVRAPWDDCYCRLKEEICLRQYSPKTFKTYATWVGQFQTFLDNKKPAEVNSDDARRFLTHLAVHRRVGASTQNQAFNALLFFYRHILKKDYELGDTVVRARRTRFIPVVLSRAEVDAVISRLAAPYNLAVQLLYGCGLRLNECLTVRVQCLNFDEGILTVHDGKGRKDRSVPLPKALWPALRAQLEVVQALYEQDIAAGYDGVFMPGAIDRKWKSASKEYIWQWLFPAKTVTLVPKDNEHRRYHLHDSELQKALRQAVHAARIPKRVSCHTFRHSFASHLLRANFDIRTIQQLLGHSDVRTTMIYTHTVKSRTLKEMTSPLDFSAEQIGYTEETRAKSPAAPCG